MSNPIVLLIFRVCFYGALMAGCVLAFSPLDRALHANFDDKLLHYAGFFCFGPTFFFVSSTCAINLASVDAVRFWPLY